MLHAISFAPRSRPLRPAAVVGFGPSACALARRVLAFDDLALGELRAVAGPGLLAIVASEERLPWADGVCYVGSEPSTPGFLWPTHSAPTVHPALVAEALQAKLKDAARPVAVIASPMTLVPLGDAWAIDRGRLRSWLEVEELR